MSISHTQSLGSAASRTECFSCLYTKHKTQKRKVFEDGTKTCFHHPTPPHPSLQVWQDGRLVMRGSSFRLYTADPPPGSGDPMIDQCELSLAEVNLIRSGQRTDLETERFLLTVDGPWIGKTATSLPTPKSVTVSRGMSKLLQSKFRKPMRTNGPPPPPRNTPLQNRKRPLQPGELYSRYYGNQQQITDTRHPPPHRQPQVTPPPPPSIPIGFDQPVPPQRSAYQPPTASQNHGGTFNTNNNTHHHDRQGNSVPIQHANPYVAPSRPPPGPQPLHQTNGSGQQEQPKDNFVKNSQFNAYDFYEEEEEEEDDHDDACASEGEEEPGPDSFSLSQQPIHPPRSKTKEALSSSQLMNLFGGGSEGQFVLPDDSSDEE